MNCTAIFVTFLLAINIIVAQTALAVEKVTLTVNDLDVSVPYYEEVLNFKKVRSFVLKGKDFQRLVGIDNERLSAEVVELRLGDETIALQEFINEKQARAVPLDSKSNDLWFQHIAVVVSDMDKAYEKLWAAKVIHVSTAPQTLPEYLTAAAGIKAFYFQDPDGHNIEIIYFPDDKGDPKWQQDKKALFLGIYHTAIGIDKTVISSEFYENLLGLKTMGHGENFGKEQEHLNQVFGARLIISGLRAKNGIGVEFLDYIAPPGGRAYPADSAPTDLWHWHTTIKVPSIKDSYKQLLAANTTFISKAIVTLDHQKQFMIRDVDGHALLLIE